MAKAVVARKAGDDYQDDFFWLMASRLLRGSPCVESVGYEVETLPGFDDVAVFYQPPIRDEYGDPVVADYYQIKCHVDYSGACTSELLAEPQFINSTTTSLLQRVQSIQRGLAPEGKGIRLNFVSPWPIGQGDPLGKIVSTQNGEIRFEVLSKGGRRSAMGKVRSSWTKHLRLKTEDELKQVLRPLRIHPKRYSQSDLREQVDNALMAAGFASVGGRSFGNPYRDLIRCLHREGHTRFDRNELTQACKDAGLFVEPPVVKMDVTRIGVRSFLRWAEYLEDETEYLLDLLPMFDNRVIRSPELWVGTMLPQLRNFLYQHIKSGGHYYIYLDTHASISFTSGYILGMKTGANVVPMQRTAKGQIPWEISDGVRHIGNHGWIFDELAVGEGADVALAVSVTHDIIGDVRLFVARDLPTVGHIVHAHVAGGPSTFSIKDGDHAFVLAQQLVAKARRKRSIQPNSHLHLFFAAPNGLVYFMGRHARALGNIVLYEYDFETNAPGGYSESLRLPS